MKIYKTQEEVEKDIVDDILQVSDDVVFECDISIDASIYARNINAGNIYARNIDAGDIKAWNIKSGNINARNINARNINAGNINAGNIYAVDIDAGDIKSGDINARNIDARNINAGNMHYSAVAFAHKSFRCSSIKGRRENSRHFCLDREIEIIL